MQGTPLMTASAYNKPQVVEILLKHNANRDAKDSDGKTALDYAKENNHQDIIKLLTEFKPNKSPSSPITSLQPSTTAYSSSSSTTSSGQPHTQPGNNYKLKYISDLKYC